MAGRGGRGGRWGGRGGRGTLAMDLARETAEDLGVAGLNYGDGPPPLYPEISLPPPSNLTADDRYIIGKQHDLLYRLHRTPFYLNPESAVSDVERWSDWQSRNSTTSGSLESHLTESAAGSHLPPELVGGRKLGGRTGGAVISVLQSLLDPGKDSKTLASLEERESRQAARGVSGGGDGDEERKEGEEEGESEGDGDFDDADDDADNDYGHDYYASENESAGEDF